MKILEYVLLLENNPPEILSYLKKQRNKTEQDLINVAINDMEGHPEQTLFFNWEAPPEEKQPELSTQQKPNQQNDRPQNQERRPRPVNREPNDVPQTPEHNPPMVNDADPDADGMPALDMENEAFINYDPLMLLLEKKKKRKLDLENPAKPEDLDGTLIIANLIRAFPSQERNIAPNMYMKWFCGQYADGSFSLMDANGTIGEYLQMFDRDRRNPHFPENRKDINTFTLASLVQFLNSWNPPKTNKETRDEAKKEGFGYRTVVEGKDGKIFLPITYAGSSWIAQRYCPHGYDDRDSECPTCPNGRADWCVSYSESYFNQYITKKMFCIFVASNGQRWMWHFENPAEFKNIRNKEVINDVSGMSSGGSGRERNAEAMLKISEDFPTWNKFFKNQMRARTNQEDSSKSPYTAYMYSLSNNYRWPRDSEGYRQLTSNPSVLIKYMTNVVKEIGGPEYEQMKQQLFTRGSDLGQAVNNIVQLCVSSKMSLPDEDAQKIEEKIKMFPFQAAKYGAMFRRGGWPEAEPSIIKDPDAIIHYAKHGLRRRWPEAEQYLIKKPAKVEEYNQELMSKGERFSDPKIERSMLKWPKFAINYWKKAFAKTSSHVSKCNPWDDFVENGFDMAKSETDMIDAAWEYMENVEYDEPFDWPEAERKFVKSPRTAYLYANSMKQGPWPEAEPYIATSAEYSYLYAVDCLGKNRFNGKGRTTVDAEPAIASNKGNDNVSDNDYRLKYGEDVLAHCKERSATIENSILKSNIPSLMLDYAEKALVPLGVNEWKEAEPVIFDDAMATLRYAKKVTDGAIDPKQMFKAVSKLKDGVDSQQNSEEIQYALQFLVAQSQKENEE
jgi:hypothetical protein